MRLQKTKSIGVPSIETVLFKFFAEKMNNELPLVSILMTAFNREAFIAEAIESVLCSSYKNFELIIVDDCSKDKTVEIAKGYALVDSRIQIHKNDKNLGDYANRNHASTFALGEYMMFVDSDDKIFPFSIEYCLGEMEKDISVDMGIFSADENLKDAIMNGAQSIPHHYFIEPFLIAGPGATILKKSFFEKIGQYPTLYGPANDMYFNLKAAAEGKIRVLTKEFLFYRIHNGQEKNNKFSYLYNNYNYNRDALIFLPLPLTESEKAWVSKKNKRRFSVNLIKYFFKTFNISKTYQAFKLANFSIKDALAGLFHR